MACVYCRFVDVCGLAWEDCPGRVGPGLEGGAKAEEGPDASARGASVGIPLRADNLARRVPRGVTASTGRASSCGGFLRTVRPRPPLSSRGF